MSLAVGFLGLGQMGKPMALNVVKAGFPLYTTRHNRPQPVEELVAAGATALPSMAEVAAQADILILCLPDPAAVLNAVQQPGGILSAIRPGTVIVDTGTSGLEATKECVALAAACQVGWVDAPISGGIWGAQAGTLTFMAGGEAADVERARPVLEPMAGRIVHVGPSGAGQATKLVNNMMACINATAIGEAFTLGVKAGVKVEALHEVISHSSGNNWVLENAAPHTIFTGNYEPGGRLKTMVKDLNLVAELARSLGAPLLLGGLVYQLHLLMMTKGYADRDATVVARFYEEALGVSLMANGSDGAGEGA